MNAYSLMSNFSIEAQEPGQLLAILENTVAI